ncbi:6-pyruvoyl-tetrahydropterin synthase-related protein [Candidatus Omnitrophota bacterium]
MSRYLTIILFSILIFYPIFQSGYLVYIDNPHNYSEMEFLAKNLLPNYGWINGWSMQSYLGYPILLYRPQVGYFLAIVLSAIFGLSLLISYKFMILVSMAFLGCSMYTLVAHRFGRMAGLCASFVLMLQKDIYYDKIMGGIWNNYLSIGLLLIFFHLLDKYYDSLTIKKRVALGLLFGLIILSHLYTGIFAILLFLIYCLIFNKKDFVKNALIPSIGLAMAFFYIYPFIETGYYFRKLTVLPKPLFYSIALGLKGLLGGFDRKAFFLVNLPLVMRDLFGIAGILFFLRWRFKDSREGRFLIAAGLLIVTALILHTNVLFLIPFWKHVPFVSDLQSHRFLVYAHIGFFIFSGYGVSIFFSKLGKRRKVVLFSLILLFLASFVAHKYAYINVGTKTFEQLPDSKDLRALWSWVSDNVDSSKTRIVYQSTVGNVDDAVLGMSDLVALAHFYSKVPQIGGFSGATPYPTEKINRTDKKTLFGDSIFNLDDKGIAVWMKRVNAEYMVSCEENLERKLLHSENFYHERGFGRFNVFRLKNFTPAWVDFKDRGTNFRLVRFENRLLEMDIQNKNSSNLAKVKVSFHPYWKAYLNGKPVFLESDELGLMKIPLRETGDLKLKLYYDSKKIAPLFISLASLMAALVILILPNKKYA